MFINNNDYYTVSGISTTTPIEYDKIGNIEKQYRRGTMDVSGTSCDFIDKLEYTYDDNRLKAVNAISNVWKVNNFKDGSETETEFLSFTLCGIVSVRIVFSPCS